MKYKLPVAKPFIDEADIRGIVGVLKSGQLSLGPMYRKFESNFAKYAGAKHACAVSSGTAGLHLAVRALDLRPGDEVITTPFSFIASSNCLLYEGVKPVFADIDPKTLNIDPNLIEKAITKKTRALLIVHIFGQTADMDAILKIARKHRLAVIEDACESIGATFRGRMAGTFGDIGVFAFYPNKQITTGEGGMIVTDSGKLNRICSSLRNQGRDDLNRLRHDRLGYNYRLDEMSASLGITQLKKINAMIQARSRIARWYRKHLCGISDVVMPTVAPHRTHSWFAYAVRIKNGKRRSVMENLKKSGVQTKPYLPVIHLQPFMVKRFCYRKGDFPEAEQAASETLALPLFIGMKERDVKRVAAVIKQSI